MQEWCLKAGKGMSSKLKNCGKMHSFSAITNGIVFINFQQKGLSYLQNLSALISGILHYFSCFPCTV